MVKRTESFWALNILSQTEKNKKTLLFQFSVSWYTNCVMSSSHLPAYYKEKIVALKTKIGLYVVDLTDSSNTEVIEVAIQNSLETELASTQKALEEAEVECVKQISKIQTLETEKIKLETEVTSAHKTLEVLRLFC